MVQFFLDNNDVHLSMFPFLNRVKGENGSMSNIAIQLTMQGMFYGEGRFVAQGLIMPFFRKHRT